MTLRHDLKMGKSGNPGNPGQYTTSGKKCTSARPAGRKLVS
jgi:hypothetical protein